MDEHLHNHVDKLFGDSLKSYKDEPREEVWERIENQLDIDVLILYKARKRRRILMIVSFFVLLAGAGTFILNYYKPGKSSISSSIQGNVKSITQPGKTMGNNPQIQNIKSDLTADKNRNDLIHPDLILTSGRNIHQQSAHSLSFSDRSLQNLNNSLSTDAIVFGLHPVSLDVQGTINTSFNINGKNLLTELEASEKIIIKPEKQSFKSRLSIVPYFSKEFAGYNLSDDDATAADGKEIEERERNVFSASIGIYLNYRIKKRWFIQTGLSYSWSNSNIDSSKSFAVLGNNGSVQYKFNTISGYGFLQPLPTIQPSVGDSVFTAKAYSQLHYLTVPLIISYSIPLKRFSLLIGTGVSFNILTGATVETKIYGLNFTQDETAIPMKGLKKINYGFLLKADLGYYFNSKLGIDLIPCFKNSLTPINIHSALSAYPYNIGIGAGISYRF
jgi:Outer membrane protein beta-barrel domain